jgi:hypothetical protein
MPNIYRKKARSGTPEVNAPMLASQFVTILNTEYAVMWDNAYDLGTPININLSDITCEWLEGLAVGSLSYLIGDHKCVDSSGFGIYTYEIEITIPENAQLS